MPETRLHRGAEHIEQHLRGHADLPAAALLDDRADRDAEEDRKDDDRQEFSLRQRLERIHEEVVDQLQQRAAAPSPETKLLNLPHERRGMFPGIPHARIHEQRESGPEHGGEEGGKKIPGHNPHAETPELPQRQTGRPRHERQEDDRDDHHLQHRNENRPERRENGKRPVANVRPGIPAADSGRDAEQKSSDNPVDERGGKVKFRDFSHDPSLICIHHPPPNIPGAIRVCNAETDRKPGNQLDFLQIACMLESMILLY